jgi:hypothetical protein
MSLIDKHGLSILYSLVIVIVVESSSSRSTTNNSSIRVDSSTEVFLLTITIKDAFKLTLSHSIFDLLHYLDMAFTGNSRCPSQYINFFITLDNSALAKYVMHGLFINLKVLPVFLFRNVCCETRVAVYTFIQVNDLWSSFLKPFVDTIN